MNDIVLAALVNIFSLLAFSSKMDRKEAERKIRYYLVYFYGIQSCDRYIEMFNMLIDVYEEKSPDYAKVIYDIVTRLKTSIDHVAHISLMVRAMEFVDNDADDRVLHLLARYFGVDKEMYATLERFDHGTEGENVALRTLAEGGKLVLMWLDQTNTILVRYEGKRQMTMNGQPVRTGIAVVWPKNGVLVSDKQRRYYYERAYLALGRGNEHEHLVMEGKHLNYRFPGSENGLHDFTFSVRDGELVAVMGGSGTGKSTLMNIINGSLRPDSGVVTINGLSLYDNLKSLKSLLGFVPQDDLLIPQLSVRDNLMYTARFCFANDTREQIDARVQKVLDDLGLAYIADLKVGTPLQKTISGGQRKRLNIALELIREPAVLFLDEPTSGLSSADSERVIQMLKNLTFQGKLIIVNIHQPSSDIYKMFDRLWLMDKGGYPIYDGNNIEAVTYFKKLANLVDADKTICPTCGNITPDIILEIVDQEKLNSKGEQTGIRRMTPEDWHAAYLSKDNDSDSDFADASRHATPLTTEGQHESIVNKRTKKPSLLGQYAIFFQRALRTYLADRQAVVIALLQAPILALVLSWLTRYAGDQGYTLFDNKNLMSYMFMAIIVSTFMGMSGSAETIFRDRAILKREQFLRLSYRSYIMAVVSVSAIVVAIQTLLFLVVGNAVLKIFDLFFVWYIILFTSGLLASIMGLILSQRMKTIVSIYITIPVLLIPQILLCGLVVPFTDMVQHSKTGNVPLIGDIIPSRWAFEALAVTSYTDNEYMRDYYNNLSMQYSLQMAREGQLRTMRQAVKQEISGIYDDDAERSDNLAMISGEHDRLVAKWGVPPAAKKDSMQEMLRWIDVTDRLLYKKSKGYTLAIMRDKSAYIKSNGKGSLLTLQQKRTNRRLEEMLAGLDAKQLVRQEHDVLVPVAGIVYLDSESSVGRAPFYSANKHIGNLAFTTLQFNLSMLWLMIAVALSILLAHRLK